MEVRAENVTMQFDDASRQVKVFHDLSLRVPSGESLSIVGKSGSGKTTLLYLLGGLEIPSFGDVYLGDTCISEMARRGQDVAPFRGANIGFVFQFHHLLAEFDAQENVAMPLIIRGVERSEAMERATKLLSRVGLSQRLSHRPGMLSGGEQQRVAIARALVASPGVVLADEPTGNLDVNTGQEVGDLLLELHVQEKITLIVVTHSPELASRMMNTFEIELPVHHSS